MENAGVKTELICPYWIVNSDEERERLEAYFGQKIEKLIYSYPYTIGKEGSFVFQDQAIGEIPSFLDEKSGTLYKYQFQSLPG